MHFAIRIQRRSTMTGVLKFVETRLSELFEHFIVNTAPSILLMTGPPGTGKTVAVRMVAARHPEIRFVFYNPTISGVPADALGHFEFIANETVWVPGSIGEALVREGTILVVDDAHLVAMHVSLFAGVGDESRTVTIPSTGEQIQVANGVRLVILANPPAADCPPWERYRYDIPEPIRDRARVIAIDGEFLSRDDELAIAATAWPADYPRSVLEGVVDVCRDLRKALPSPTYTPSPRSEVHLGSFLSQGLTLSDAFEQALCGKFLRAEEVVAARAAFVAKFGAAAQSALVVDKEAAHVAAAVA
jgi:MoxR-like ATPase